MSTWLSQSQSCSLGSSSQESIAPFSQALQFQADMDGWMDKHQIPNTSQAGHLFLAAERKIPSEPGVWESGSQWLKLQSPQHLCCSNPGQATSCSQHSSRTFLSPEKSLALQFSIPEPRETPGALSREHLSLPATARSQTRPPKGCLQPPGIGAGNQMETSRPPPALPSC